MEMHQAMMSGSGILDSIGNFFKTSFNNAKNWVTSKLPQNKAAAPKIPKDLGPQYDHLPADYKKPKLTGIDYVANKINKFDNMVNRTFNYMPTGYKFLSNVSNWKEQKLQYDHNRYNDDFNSPDSLF